MNKTIIEAAISGFGGKARNPNNPVTPDEVATDILAYIGAGAAVVHNHIDDYMAIGPAAAAPLRRGLEIRAGGASRCDSLRHRRRPGRKLTPW